MSDFLGGAIAVIGDENSILPFRAIGAALFEASDGKSANEFLSKVIEDKYAIVFISEIFQEQTQPLLNDNPDQTYLFIPPIRGADGSAKKALDELIQKTVGVKY